MKIVEIKSLLFTISRLLWLISNWHYLRKNPEFNANKKHIAIVLANSYGWGKFLIYILDIPELIEYFKKKKWAYKIYFEINKQKLYEIINNPKTTIVYLIGHGERHGIKINPEENVHYCEFANSPKKKFVAQLHCNNRGGRSLAEYIAINPAKSFVTDKTLTDIEIHEFIAKVIRGKLHSNP